MFWKTKIKLLFVVVISCLFFGCFLWREETKVKKPPVSPKEIVGEINIIPQPNIVKRLPGRFDLNSETKITITDEFGINSSNLLNDLLSKKYGLNLNVIKQTESENSIIFSVISSAEQNTEFAEEEYFLKVEPNLIEIKGTERGIFYAIQSLSQIITKEPDGKIYVPAVEISDAPRFRYRGLHLDVARHFMSASYVKRYISLMAFYKYNYFHWHLTDDQGWRIEINKYPLLTKIGSRRPETVVGKNYNPYRGDGKPVSGFYTQDEIRDVVEFAKSKNITVIPEIDLPGHSSAALAAYPELGCKDKNYQYKIKTTWGGFTDIYCPKENTFKFLEDVLGEVIDLFPNSPYIHIGGDEVKTDHWKESAFVRELMKREGLANESEVQGWFIKRIENFVNSRGKKIIGWDEIINKHISDEATIMAWQDVSRVVAAAKANHEVIATPSDFTYFDHPQGNPDKEPLMNLGSPVTLETVYEFDPIPNELSEEEAKYIIGGQGCVWTEFLKNPKSVEYMAFPRSIALAEVLWSKRDNRDYNSFIKRLKKEFVRLDKENVSYRIPKPIGLTDEHFPADKKALVEIESPVPSGKIFFTLDGTEPNLNSKMYQKPFPLDLQANQTVEVKTMVLNSRGRTSVIYNAKYKR